MLIPIHPAASAAPHPATLLDRLRKIERAPLVLGGLLLALGVFLPAHFPVALRFMMENLLNLLPVLLLSVGLAAAIKASGADTLVAQAFAGREKRAIVLAALAGALSPLCSCGVVPLIAGLLASGVPLAPVMAFWLASPVMDPAMFVLTAGAIGWEFAVAKTLAAIAIGLIGGLVTMFLARAGRFDATLKAASAARAPAGASGWASTRLALQWRFWREPARRRLFAENAWTQARKLAVLMLIAFVLESLMMNYLPADGIARWMGGEGLWAIPAAVALGVPAYLNGVAAVPLIGGLIELGMNPAVGLAFMVAGGVTSIPAMMAVWALVKPKVFALYLGLAVSGSLLVGYAYAAYLA